MSGKWTALDAGIGAGVDSYFEYLVKGAALFQYPQLIEQFHGEYPQLIEQFHGEYPQLIKLFHGEYPQLIEQFHGKQLARPITTRHGGGTLDDGMCSLIHMN